MLNQAEFFCSVSKTYGWGLSAREGFQYDYNQGKQVYEEFSERQESVLQIIRGSNVQRFMSTSSNILKLKVRSGSHKNLLNKLTLFCVMQWTARLWASGTAEATEPLFMSNTWMERSEPHTRTMSETALRKNRGNSLFPKLQPRGEWRVRCPLNKLLKIIIVKH